MALEDFVNTRLLFNPLNWIIVILMIGMAAVFVSLALAGLQSTKG